MLSFRKKILLSDLVLFLIFISFLFPFVERTVHNIVRNSLEQRASELMVKIRKESNLEGMIDYLSAESSFVFFRITLFDQKGKVLYDSKTSSEETEQLVVEEKSEVIDALKYGKGFVNRYSSTYRQIIAYAAFSYEVNDQEYVLRIGFPFSELRELTHDLEIGFVTIGMVILLLYSFMTWAIMHRLSVPIQEIIAAVEPYQEGRNETLPKIEIGKEIQEGDEFGKLASTLNSLNARIQKQIENLVGQRNETKSILEALGEGVIAVGQDGLITFVNRAAYDMLRIERETLLNCKLSEIHAGRAFLGKKSRELLEQAFESRETLVETIVVQEKQKLHFNLIATPLEKPGVIILVLQDKTSDYLVVEMGKDFVANASHELRTPITVIRGFAETVLDMPQLTQEQLREIFEKIVKTSVRLDSLVQSLLSLADLEHMDEERFTKVDLVKVCENCVQLFSAAHPQANLQLHKHVSQAIARAEGDLLEMAVMNLLQNAVKYSPAKAKVDLTIQKQKDFYEIVVTDQGIGIPEQDLPHLFDRFYTVDKARSRKFGGTGLGLSIAKTIVDKHHGTIRVVSHVGQGSSFTISLLGLND